jgi:hypothetical protein
MAKAKFNNYQNKVRPEEQYTKEELEQAVSDFLESCHRTGHHDLEDNVHYFLRENDHIQLDENEVRRLFKEIEEADYGRSASNPV